MTLYSEVVHDVMSGIARFSSFDWTCAEENVMIKELGYEKQKNGYSCGFYVISTLASLLVVDLGCLSGYGYKPKYDRSVTELIRRSSIKAFFKRVEEAYQTYEMKMPIGTKSQQNRYLQRFSDMEVTLYIQLHKYGYVPQNDVEKIKQRHVKWNSHDVRDSMTIEDPEKNS